ncbi:flagellar hook-associated protein FlgK [Methylogaea oryzae]|uniref:flagellar hook-associated protein FlgK n=1 Tax=Methylogaea oryzae TaxID=1295382 RepID=UPI0006D22D75|nr:flagellar hook-associated protein FlgK [Methylogaea oryzae]
MSSVLNIATSGLISFQRSLQTISHNISNSGTEGYSRQIVDLKQSIPTFTGTGYVGNGVNVTGIARSYDDFLIKQVRDNTATQQQSEAYATLAKQVDSFIADDSVNLGNVMQEFFNSIQDVSTDPTSIAARQTMLGQADSMTVRFQAVTNRLDEMRAEVNGNLGNMVTQVNSASQSIAKLNQAISAALAGGGQAPSDLLDQRDQQILELSKIVGVNVLPQKNGQVAVIIGNGQSLVDGTSYSQLKAQTNAYGESKDLDINLITPNGVSTTITSNITGGGMGGVLGFRNQILDPTQNAIGRIVVGLTEDFNAQHVMGYDLNGVQGVNFFSAPPALW